MENWGLVTYQEYSLLYHVGAHKLHAAMVIAHELAHMVSDIFSLYKIIIKLEKYCVVTN